MGISFLANPVTKWMYGTGTSPVERGTVGLLGDRSTVALGARVLHPTHGAGRIEGVADNVPDPSDPPLIVIFEEDGARLVQAHELRRLPGPSID